MRRIIAPVLTAIGSIVTTIIGAIQNNPILIHVGIIIGGFLTLCLLTWAIKKLFSLVKVNLSSSIFLTLVSITLFVLAWYGFINTMTALSGGIVVGLLMLLTFVRFISRHAQSSMFFGEIFSFFTGYQVRAFIERKSIISKESRTEEHNDYKNIIAVLRSSGLGSHEAKSAADYAIAITDDDDSLDDKITKAFQYHGKNMEK